MQQRTADLGHLRPNPWNPNRMDDRHFAAEVESIRTFGFVDPITVRQHPDDPALLEIVDGEHRYRALVHLYAQDAPSPGLPPRSEIPVVDLGRLDDATAQSLTLVLNETRGHAPREDVAHLLDDIATLVGPDAARRGLPIDEAQMEELLALARRGPALDELPEVLSGEAPPPPSTDDPGGDQGTPREPDDERRDLHRIVMMVRDDQLASVRAARQLVEDEEGDPLPRDEAAAWGVVIARLARVALMNTA